MSWFDATSATSPGISPRWKRTRRSPRQCPWRDARSATRGRVAEIVHAPVHREAFGDGRERGRELGARRVDVELDALQEQPGRGVGVLVGLDDVAARLGDERADRGDDAGLVGALEQEHGAHVFFNRRAEPLRRA